MSAEREVWVKIRASKAERAEWHAKARSIGLSLSDLVRRSVDRVRTWTVALSQCFDLLPVPLGPLRRVPDRAARVLLTVIDRDPEAIVRPMKPRSASASLAETSWFTWSAWVKW